MAIDKAKRNARQKRWRDKNPKRVAASQAKSHKRHAAKIAIQKAEWAAAHKDHRRIQLAAWRAAHPEARSLHEGKRRALKLSGCPVWAEKTAIAAIYLEAVAMTQKTGVKHVVDHEIPLVHPLVCGLHVPANLRVITQTANAVKSNRFEAS